MKRKVARFVKRVMDVGGLVFVVSAIGFVIVGSSYFAWKGSYFFRVVVGIILLYSALCGLAAIYEWAERNEK